MNDEHDDDAITQGLSPVAGAGMGVGVGAALTAATGDGTWIGAFAAFGASVALALSAVDRRRPGRRDG